MLARMPTGRALPVGRGVGSEVSTARGDPSGVSGTGVRCAPRVPCPVPYVLRYTPGDALAIITHTGRITGYEVAESVEALAARLPETPGRISVLSDTREATSIMALPGDVERAVRVFRAFEARVPEGRGAYVGGRNHAVFVGLLRVLLKMLGPGQRERGVFTDYDEALRWLQEPVA